MYVYVHIYIYVYIYIYIYSGIYIDLHIYISVHIFVLPSIATYRPYVAHIFVTHIRSTSRVLRYTYSFYQQHIDRMLNVCTGRTNMCTAIATCRPCCASRVLRQSWWVFRRRSLLRINFNVQVSITGLFSYLCLFTIHQNITIYSPPCASPGRFSCIGFLYWSLSI